MNLSEIRLRMNEIKAAAEAKGFNEVEVDFSMNTERDRYYLILRTYDDFQPSKYNDDYFHGSEYFNADELEDLFLEALAYVTGIPSRARRELQFQMKNVASALEVREKMVTLAGQEFAETLLAQRAQYNHLLENLK